MQLLKQFILDGVTALFGIDPFLLCNAYSSFAWPRTLYASGIIYGTPDSEILSGFEVYDIRYKSNKFDVF